MQPLVLRKLPGIGPHPLLFYMGYIIVCVIHGIQASGRILLTTAMWLNRPDTASLSNLFMCKRWQKPLWISVFITKASSFIWCLKRTLQRQMQQRCRSEEQARGLMWSFTHSESMTSPEHISVLAASGTQKGARAHSETCVLSLPTAFLFPFCHVKQHHFGVRFTLLTLLTSFGILDVRYRLGTQGPHCYP